MTCMVDPEYQQQHMILKTECKTLLVRFCFQHHGIAYILYISYIYIWYMWLCYQLQPYVQWKSRVTWDSDVSLHQSDQSGGTDMNHHVPVAISMLEPRFRWNHIESNTLNMSCAFQQLQFPSVRLSRLHPTCFIYALDLPWQPWALALTWLELLHLWHVDLRDLAVWWQLRHESNHINPCTPIYWCNIFRNDMIHCDQDSPSQNGETKLKLCQDGMITRIPIVSVKHSSSLWLPC